jgi:hypothetical protein
LRLAHLLVKVLFHQILLYPSQLISPLLASAALLSSTLLLLLFPTPSFISISYLSIPLKKADLLFLFLVPGRTSSLM